MRREGRSVAMGKQAKKKVMRAQVRQQVIKLYIETAIPVFKDAFSPDCCLNGTRVTLEVLGRLGFKARPLVTHSLAMNAAFWTRLRESGDWPQQEVMDAWVKDGAWAVGVDGVQPEAQKGYEGGHLVVVVQGLLLDSAAGQFARPAKDIIVPPMVVASVKEEFLAGKAPLVLTEEGDSKGTVLTYNARPADRTYLDTPGFQPHHGNMKVVQCILETMREQMEIPAA